jgi:hypothetical protein
MTVSSATQNRDDHHHKVANGNAVMGVVANDDLAMADEDGGDTPINLSPSSVRHSRHIFDRLPLKATLNGKSEPNGQRAECEEEAMNLSRANNSEVEVTTIALCAKMRLKKQRLAEAAASAAAPQERMQTDATSWADEPHSALHQLAEAAQRKQVGVFVPNTWRERLCLTAGGCAWQGHREK